MTGGGEGCCILKLPDGSKNNPAESAIRVGQPADRAGEEKLGWARLRWEVRRIEASLDAIRARLKRIETTSMQHAVERR
jgi:hypothetical protein